MSIQDLIPILQFAVSPVILISGVGLLLLSMTNRLGRVIDRARKLMNELRVALPEQRASVIGQLHILLKQARVIRLAIALSAVSMLLAAFLVIVLFIGAVLRVNLALPSAGLFIACMLSLIASLVLFIADINGSLTALKLEVGSLDDGGG